MNVKIETQTENKLLNRKELRALIENNGATPKSEEVGAKVAALLNVDKSLVVVETVHQYFGAKKSEAQVKVYNTADDLKKTEPKPKEKKAAAGTAPAAAAPAAQPAPKKEEAKAA